MQRVNSQLEDFETEIGSRQIDDFYFSLAKLRFKNLLQRSRRIKKRIVEIAARHRLTNQQDANLFALRLNARDVGPETPFRHRLDATHERNFAVNHFRRPYSNALVVTSGRRATERVVQVSRAHTDGRFIGRISKQTRHAEQADHLRRIFGNCGLRDSIRERL